MIGYPPEFLIRARKIPVVLASLQPTLHLDDDFSSTQVYQRSLEIDYSAARVAGTDASCEIDRSKLVKNGDHAGDD